MFLNELVSITKGKIICGDTKNKIVGKICIDPNIIEKNDIFVNFNGCIDVSVFDKASVIITDKRFKFKCSVPVIFVKNIYSSIVRIGKFNRNKFIDKPIICVTGSLGKRFVCNLLYSVLKVQYNVLFSDSCDLIDISILLSCIDDRHDIIICSCGIDYNISKISKIIKPTICIITNILINHISCFFTQENIFREKMHIVRGMNYGNLIVNGSDFYLNSIKSCRKYSVIKTSEDIISDVLIDDKISFNIYLDNKLYSIVFNGTDVYYVDYILLVISCASIFCISNNSIIKVINSFQL